MIKLTFRKGVVFSLVIVRVALGISSESRNTRTKMTTLAFSISGVGSNTIDDSRQRNDLNPKAFRGNTKEGSQVEDYT